MASEERMGATQAVPQELDDSAEVLSISGKWSFSFLNTLKFKGKNVTVKRTDGCKQTTTTVVYFYMAFST